MSAQISLYAELLQNIRQVSLAASLPSPSNASTNATVTSDGSAIHLRHDGLDAQLALPASVDAAACPSPLPVQPVASSLSWRLPLATAAAPQQQQQRSGDEVVPWPATDLLPGEPVRCRGCGEPVVGAGRVGAWKDLPSENWAEMMEFWHCHKPDDAGHGHGHGHGAPRDGEQGGAAGGPAQANELGGDGPAPAAETDGKADEQSLASRGYGANSIISAQEGVGFVDLTSLLFAEGDCEGILYSLASGTGSMSRAALMDEEVAGVRQTIHISCAACEAQLGYFNDRTSAVTLFKWQVSCTTKETLVPPPSTPPPQPTIPECLSATLIATTSRSGSSKAFLIPTLESANPATPTRIRTPARVLHLWTLNSAIRYTSTLLPEGQKPIHAMKLLYRTVDRGLADRTLENVTSDAQEVGLPADAIADVAAALDDGNALLPPGERAFKEWRVGLLRRWDGGLR